MPMPLPVIPDIFNRESRRMPTPLFGRVRRGPTSDRQPDPMPLPVFPDIFNRESRRMPTPLSLAA